MKTFVIADLHGNYRLLDNFLMFSGYSKYEDRLIHAGDFCDIGVNTAAVLGTLEMERAIILVGNHEFAHCYKYPITPYDYSLDKFAADYWMQRILNKDWGIAYAVDDILITHAGISQALWGFKQLEDNSVQDIAEFLNSVFWNSTSFNGSYLELLSNKWLNYDQRYSPIWYRPFDTEFIEGDIWVNNPAPIKQVVGHTPLIYYPKETQQTLLDMNFIMVDPYSRDFHNDDYCMWAEIEDGNISIHMSGV